MAKRKMGFNPDESKKIHDFLDNFAQDNEGRKTEIPLQDAILENTNLIMKLYLTLIVIVHRASKNDHSLAEEICNELDELAVLLDNKMRPMLIRLGPQQVNFEKFLGYLCHLNPHNESGSFAEVPGRLKGEKQNG